MKNLKWKLIALSLLFAIPVVAQEEEKKLPFEIGADLMSRYVWRGQCIDKSPNIQPYFVYAPSFGLEVGAWGSYSFSGDFAEVDLYLAYGIGGFYAALTDYFVMDESLANNHFFDYRKSSTGHALEGMLSYEGPEKFPMKIMLGTMFYGADQELDHVVIDTVLNDTTAFYKNLYSTYIELSYKIRNISVFAGITPAAGYYGDNFALVNLGVKAERDIRITDKYALPVQASLIMNPHRQNIYLVFGITF